MIEPIVTKRDYCPACLWPTYAKNCGTLPARVPCPPRMHPQIRAIQHSITYARGVTTYHTVALEFTCPRCEARWTEEVTPND